MFRDICTLLTLADQSLTSMSSSFLSVLTLISVLTACSPIPARNADRTAPMHVARSFGITSTEVTEIMDTGHHLQLWKPLDLTAGLKRFRVEIKHAAIGPEGAFAITAWEDSDEDSFPDREIGRSQIMVAREKGDWSAWEFQCEGHRIFVGNTWEQKNERVYYQMGSLPPGWSGLSHEVYFSREINRAPIQNVGPRATNIVVTLLNSRR